ncbi:MAG: Sua5/YciO/YrdC/YwlC family protein, partial [Candidatus Nanopelagicales bacterium]|nr:Sua5/YciO/YrdC/YwlC family protein [Candidatus Nanopelagicales bacterium]
MSAGQLWECADGANRETAVRGAVAAMRRGGLVILPTENSYVVAADAFSLRGTALLRRAKMVPESTPLGLLVASPVVVSGVAARVPRVAKKLMEAFWPGLLTVLLRPQP